MGRYAGTCGVALLVAAGLLAAACGHLAFDELPLPSDLVSGDGGDAAASDGGASDGALPPDGGKVPDGGLKDGGCGDLCNVTFVSKAIGKDTNPGTADLPVKTIGRGLEIASARGGKQEVRVASEVYPEKVTLAENVDLLGGYACDLKVCTWDRDVENNDTAIVAQDFEGVVAGASITQKTKLEGFRIVGKGGVLPNGSTGAVGVTITGGTPTIARCRIFAGDVSGGSAQSKRSIGVAILGPSNAPGGVRLDHDAIGAGSATDGAMAVLMEAVPPGSANAPVAVIRGSVLRGGTAGTTAGIVALGSAEGTSVRSCEIGAGTSTGQGSSPGAWGIVVASTMTIDGNRVNVDSLAGSCSGGGSQPFCGGGIVSLGSATTITNNVVLGVKGPKTAAVYLTQNEAAPGTVILNGNTLDGSGTGADGNALSAGLALGPGSGNSIVVGRVRNNILLGGANTPRYPAYEVDVPNRTAHPAAFDHNDLFNLGGNGGDVVYRYWTGNAATDVVLAQLGPLVSGGPSACIHADPAFDSNYHLKGESPCVDAGTATEAPTTDMDGDARPKGSAVDMGADEAQ